MSLLLTRSDDADSVVQGQVSVPPLFAGPLRDDLAARVDSALAAGDYEKAAVLLHEADNTFPNDPVFAPLRLRCGRLARRKAQFETALYDALNELGEDRFAAAVGKFREALALSQGHQLFTKKVCDTAVAAAEKRIQQHWRFAEALLHEMSSATGERLGGGAIWSSIESQRREESVRVALEESGRAEHTAYLPHLRDRLAELAKTYPDTESLEARLHVLDGLVTRSFAEEREKNLRRLTLFRDRLDLTANPETLRHFADLVAPFVDPYHDDPSFKAIIAEIRDLRSKYESALLLLDESRLQDVTLICDQMLQKRPANVLFCALEEKAKAREWVVRLVTSATQRARGFEKNAQYTEALEEWEALRDIDPSYPGLVSEMLHCAALKAQSEVVRSFQPAPADEFALTPEIVKIEPEVLALIVQEPAPTPVEEPLALVPRSFFEQPEPAQEKAYTRGGFKIAMTPEAWNNLKTGLIAALAVLLVVLILASSGRR